MRYTFPNIVITYHHATTFHRMCATHLNAAGDLVTDLGAWNRIDNIVLTCEWRGRFFAAQLATKTLPRVFELLPSLERNPNKAGW